MITNDIRSQLRDIPWRRFPGRQRSEGNAKAMLVVAFGIHLFSGNIGRGVLPLLGLVALAVAVPVLLGARMYIGISEVVFRKIVLGLLTASGVALLASAVPALLARG